TMLLVFERRYNRSHMVKKKTPLMPSTTIWRPDQIITICMMILTAIAMSISLAYISSLMIPFVLAVFLTYIISPMVDLFRFQCHMPRWLAVSLTFLVTLSFMGLLGLFVVLNFRGLLESADEYRARSLAVANYLIAWLSAYGVKIDN